MHKILDFFPQTFVFIASLKSLHVLNSSPANPRVAELIRALLPLGTRRPRVEWSERSLCPHFRGTQHAGDPIYDEQETSLGFTVTNASHLITLPLAWVCP